jgi:O-antigen/teichoic acid export membrane protein
MNALLDGEQKPVTNRFMSLAISNRFARWSRLSLEFALSQGLAQSAGMISGLIYVRLMPIDQYALYAMALSSLTFVAISSDLGLTGSLNYFWRRSGGDRNVIEPIIAVVQRLRWVFLVLASFVCGAFLLKTATERHFSIISVLACFGLVVATAWSQLRAVLDIQLMRLQGMQRESYYCETAGSITRLLAAVVMIATGITTALFGLAGGLLGSLSILAALKRYMRTPRGNPQPIARETWHKVLYYITPTFPTTLVYIAEGPLLLWLAFSFGGKAPLAETFAVGRVGAIYGLLTIFIGAVVGPRLARVSNDAHFARMMGLFLLALVFLSAAATTVAYLTPSALLLLIGPNYAHLEKEVVLSIAASSIGVLTAFLAMANRLRGWVRLEPVAAACQAVAIFSLASQWSFHDSASVLELMVILAGLNFLWTGITSVVGLWVPGVVRVR